MLRTVLWLCSTDHLHVLSLYARTSIPGALGCRQPASLKLWRRYDPELPERQRHRDFLRERVVFREVVPISDAAVRAKIHQTYRMGYLKDVILPR